MATGFRLIGLLVCVGMSAPARAQAAEIRARFSEPMVPIGGLPEQVSAPPSDAVILVK